MDVSVGDKMKMKKPHPCGANEWKVLRVGADFKIECQNCGHIVMLPRTKFERSVKKLLSKGGET